MYVYKFVNGRGAIDGIRWAADVKDDFFYL